MLVYILPVQTHYQNVVPNRTSQCNQAVYIVTQHTNTGAAPLGVGREKETTLSERSDSILDQLMGHPSITPIAWGTGCSFSDPSAFTRRWSLSNDRFHLL